MGQFDEIVKNTARSINNQGMTLQMAGQQMDTIERKAKQLKATLVDMFSGAGDSGLRDTLKGLLDVVNQFIMGLNNVSATVINGGLIIGGAVLAWKALSATFAALMPIMASVTGIGAGLGATMEAMAAGEISAAAGAGILEGGLAALTAETALATGGLSLLVGGLVYLIYKSGEAEKAQQQLIETVKTSTPIHQQQLNQYKDTVAFLESMQGQYNKLTAKLSTLKEGTKAYDDVMGELAGVQEAVILATDDDTKKKAGLAGATGNLSKVTGSLISEIIRLEKEHTKTAIKMLENDSKLTEQVLTNATNRVTAIGSEIDSLIRLRGQYANDAPNPTLHIGKWDTGIGVPIPGKGMVRNAIDSSIGDQKKELENAKTEQLKAQNEMEQLKLNIAKLKVGDSTDNGAGAGAGGKEKAVKDYTEAYKQYIQALETVLPSVDNVIFDHNNALDMLGTKEAIWKVNMEDAIPTMAQMQEQYGYLSQSMLEHKGIQEDLAATANTYRAGIASLNQEIADENARYASGNVSAKDYREALELLLNKKQELEKQVKGMSSSWWKEQESIINVQKEYDNLDDNIAKLKFDELKQKFDDNLISAEQYQRGIEGLEQEFTSLGASMANTLQQAEFNSILSGWNTAIDDALDKAQKKFDEAMDAIDEDIADAKQGLTDFKDAVSGIFDDIDTDTSTNFSDAILKQLPGLIGDIGNMDTDAITKILYPSVDAGALQTGVSQSGSVFSNILSGVSLPNGTELEKTGEAFNMSKDDFLADLKNGVDGLNNASKMIDYSLGQVDSWKTAELNRIDTEVENIKTKLESDVKLVTGLFDELDAAEAKYSRDTAKNNFTTSLNAAMGIQATPGVNPTVGDLQTLAAGLPGQLDLSSLGNLSAEQFASTISQGLTTLEDAKLKAEGYIQDLADSTQTQIDAIDAQLKALDEEAQKDTRADAEEEHNKKIADLQKKLAYESVRTGQEHLENMADINKQIADENESWSKQQRDWVKDDKKAELEEKKTTLQKNTDLMNQALSDFVTYINSEIQTRKDATAEYKADLEDKANADTAELETEKTNVQKRADLLTAMLNGMKQYVTDEIAEWKRLADERVDITEDEVNAQVAAFEKEKTALSDLWNDKKTGIVAITKNGVLATLAMMAAMSDGFKTQGMAMVQGLIDGITDKDLQDTLKTELQNILNATAGGVPSTTPNTASTDKVPWRQVFTNVGDNAFKSGFLASNNGNGTANVYRADGALFGVYNISDASKANASDATAGKQAAAHAKAEAARAKIKAMGIGDQNGDNILDIDQKPGSPNTSSTIAEAQAWYDKYGKGSKGASYFQDILDARNEYVKAADGAIFTKPAMTMIAEAGESEVAMPLSKFQPMMDEAVLASLTKTTRFVPDLSRINAYIKQIDGLQAQISVAVNSNFDKAADKIVAAIEKKMNIKFDSLVNVEHYEPQDNTDVEIFGREIMRQVNQK